MQPHLTLVTLGVSDLSASIAFYQRLGLTLETEDNTDSVAFFLVNGGSLRLGLFPRSELAKDAGVQDEGTGFHGFSLAHNVSSPAEVDAVLQEAVVCGARLVKAGEKVFWGGYSGYFSDPDGFLWEVAHNPFWK